MCPLRVDGRVLLVEAKGAGSPSPMKEDAQEGWLWTPCLGAYGIKGEGPRILGGLIWSGVLVYYSAVCVTRTTGKGCLFED